MNAGVTWLRRALKRPSKSVKYLEAVSSITFNLAPPLPERAHVEYEVSEDGIGNGLVPENDWPDSFFGVAIDVFERECRVWTIIELRVGQSVKEQDIAAELGVDISLGQLNVGFQKQSLRCYLVPNRPANKA